MSTTAEVTHDQTLSLRQLGVATVYEAAGRQGLVDADLVQVLPGSCVAGPARIAACGQDDNRTVHAVMDAARTGDVLVLTMPEPRPVALLGEMLAVQAKARGVAGVLVDGSVRDLEELRELGLPVWARWVRVHGATKKERGEVDAEVDVGGARITPGDVVVLDTDGAVVVPAASVADVLDASRARQQKESAMLPRLRAGELSYDIHGLRELDAQGEAPR